MISLAAPTKFQQLSFRMVIIGIPLCEMNLRNVAMKAEVVSSVACSRCTAFTENDTNTATYRFKMTGLRMDPVLIQIGPG